MSRGTYSPEIIVIVQQVIDGRLHSVERRISLEAYLCATAGSGPVHDQVRMGLQELEAYRTAGPKGTLP